MAHAAQAPLMHGKTCHRCVGEHPYLREQPETARCRSTASLLRQQKRTPRSNKWQCRSVRTSLAAAATSATKRAPAASGTASGEDADSDDLRRVIVAGAGLAGLAAAAALYKVGIPVLVLERDGELRLEGAAIAMWANAFRALDALGVAAPLREAHPLLERTELCSQDGRLLRSFSFERDCKGGPHEARGMRRGELLAAIAGALPKEAIRYHAAIASVTNEAGGATVTLENGERLRAAAVVGADGGRSAVTRSLGIPPPNYTGYSAYRGVATLQGGLPLPHDTIRQVWGRGLRVGMYPISDSEVYWFTCFNARADDGGPSTAEGRKQEALDSVRGWPFGAEAAVAATPAEHISRGRLGDRWAAPGSTYGEGAVTLAGDAAHPMTPNLGQGGCTALEDGIVLARALRPVLQAAGRSGPAADDVAGALRDYERQRSRRVFPLTLRSHAFGRLLQIPFAPVCAVRNLYVEKGFSPASFLEHATFDCGRLD